ncbi:COG1573 Uracil-DNA glycosylase [Rhabdaerophilaceae bacterium]
MRNNVDTPLRILEFQLAAGIDIALSDTPIDRFAAIIAGNQDTRARAASPEPAERTAAPAATIGVTQAAPLAPDQAAMEARRLAASAPDLETLRALLEGFDGCALKSTASRLVFADGAPGAPVMIVGEAPGRDEDEIGRPFVGRAGQLLDKMLDAIGLDRTQVYIANTVPWRPPGNRTPTPQEMAICLPFIRRQIELAQPRILLTMGAPATQTLLLQKEGILRLRGRWFNFDLGDHSIAALATLHPAYLLRQPSQKALAWRDLRALKGRLARLA